MTARLVHKLWSAVAPIFDAALVWSAILVAWRVLRHSPFAAPHAPHWARERYIVAGALAAFSYVLLSAAAGLYSSKRASTRERVPLLNFATFLVFALISVLASVRYAAWAEHDALLSRRVLFTGLVIAYLVTSFHHYVRLGFGSQRARATEGAS